MRVANCTETVTVNEARKNFLLGSLQEEDLVSLLPNLRSVSLPLGRVLHEAGEMLDFAFFPTTAIASLNYITEDGGTAEVGIVGNDGMVGTPLFLGGNTTTNRAVIQRDGDGIKISKEDLRNEFALGGSFQNLLLRYTQALMTQIAQTAVCNRRHLIEQQLCRWLLLSHDRVNSDDLVMTHDLISNMIGVRREGITLAAQKLKDKSLITHKRGTIRIVDRKGLEHAACECYQIVHTECDRLFGRANSRTFGN